MSFILNYEVFLEGSVILWKEKEGKHFIYLSSLKFYYEGDYTEDPNTADCSLESNNFKNRICQAYLSYYKKKKNATYYIPRVRSCSQLKYFALFER